MRTPLRSKTLNIYEAKYPIIFAPEDIANLNSGAKRAHIIPMGVGVEADLAGSAKVGDVLLVRESFFINELSPPGEQPPRARLLFIGDSANVGQTVTKTAWKALRSVAKSGPGPYRARLLPKSLCRHFVQITAITAKRLDELTLDDMVRLGVRASLTFPEWMEPSLEEILEECRQVIKMNWIEFHRYGYVETPFDSYTCIILDFIPTTRPVYQRTGRRTENQD